MRHFVGRLALMVTAVSLLSISIPACGENEQSPAPTSPAQTLPPTSPSAQPPLLDSPPEFAGLGDVHMEGDGYRLSWSPAIDDLTDAGSLEYRVFAADVPEVDGFDFRDHEIIVQGTSTVEIPDPDPSGSRYFMVRACDEAGNCDDNTVRLRASRALEIEKAPNFRDVGGYLSAAGRQVKWETLYRSGDLTEISDEDLNTINRLGLKRVIDLRFQLDLDRAGFDRLYNEGDESIYDFVPMTYGDPNLSIDNLPDHQYAQLAWDVRLVDYPNWYINILQESKERIRRVFDRLADPSQYPLLIHCSQGKDRAGVVSALILMLLDVPNEVIVDDYMLTCELTEEDIESKLQGLAIGLQIYSEIVPEGMTAEDWRPMLECAEDAMTNLILHIDAEYGGIAPFLQSIGVTQEQQQSIRDILLYE